MPDSYNFGGYDLSRLMGAPSGPTTDLYPTLIANIAGVGTPCVPHHPIQCIEPSTWAWNGDDSFSCKHATVPLDDEKLQAAINFSIASLLLELARDL